MRSPPDTADVDIFIEAGPSPSEALLCLESVLAASPQAKMRIHLVGDPEDPRIASILQRHPSAVNTPPGEFVQAVVESYGSWVSMLRASCIVPSGWLDRTLSSADSSTALITPALSDALRTLAPGYRVQALDSWLDQRKAEQSVDPLPSLRTASLIRRDSLDRDTLHRAVSGWASQAPPPLELNLHWHAVACNTVHVHDSSAGPLQLDCPELQRKLRQTFRTPGRWAPRAALWDAARSAHRSWTAGQPVRAMANAATGTLRALSSRQSKPPHRIHAFDEDVDRLRITYVIPELVVSGGVLSIVQLVNALILRGIDARIATTYCDPSFDDAARLLSDPMLFRSEHELVNQLPATDIAIATAAPTVDWVCALVDNGAARRSAYFVQDYEPWFCSSTDHAGRAQLEADYGRIPVRIVKSRWLQTKLRDLGHESTRIPLGLNLATFAPIFRPLSDPPTLIAMARPRTPRRGFETLVRALTAAHSAMPTLRIVLFGDRFLDRRALPFPFENAGVIFDRDELVQRLATAQVFVDSSDFQAYGRTALEAMACGCATVLPSTGGVLDYAEHRVNTMLTPPGDSAAIANAALELLRDHPLRNGIVRAAQSTATAHDLGLEADRSAELFNRVHQQRAES